MEYLCFANGRKKDECVKIYEAEIFMIDRLTSKYADSDEIRKKYAKEFSEFQRLYPNGGKGSVRLYGDSITGENGWKVMYKKHKIAFNYIVNDKKFLRWFASNDLRLYRDKRIIPDTYILNGIAIYNKELTRIKQYIESLKHDDKKKYGITGGGKRYYRFVRDLLIKYDEYCQYNKEALTVDQIWKQYLNSLQNVKLQKESIAKDIRIKEEQIEDEPLLSEVIPEFDDYEPDHIYLGEEPIYQEPLYDFFQADNFDRYFSNIFVEDAMMVIGDFSVTNDPTHIAPWASIANNCFNGDVIACDAKHFSYNDSSTFDSSKFITLIGEEDTKMLRTLTIRAIENQSQVVLISEDMELLNAYSKRFKSIIPIYNNPENNYEAQKTYVDFFVDQYQNARGYSKK